MDDQQMTTEEQFVPEYELPTVLETPEPEPEPSPLPDYVTSERLEAMFENLAAKLTPQAPTPAPTDPGEAMKSVADKLYTDPEAALAEYGQIIRQQMMAELAPNLAPALQDYQARSATAGMTPLEAEYVQDKIAKGIINPQAMSDPGVRETILDAARGYAASKPPVTPTPRAESSVGFGISVSDPEAQGLKTAFERTFGLPFSEAIKRI